MNCVFFFLPNSFPEKIATGVSSVGGWVRVYASQLYFVQHQKPSKINFKPR